MLWDFGGGWPLGGSGPSGEILPATLRFDC